MRFLMAEVISTMGYCSNYCYPLSNELYHHGILGQKWGVRRFQNPDRSLTPAGKERYRKDLNDMAKKDAQRWSDAKAAYGEGAGTRRKLIDKEIKQKMKNKEYAKAYSNAEKNVDVAKSLKKAESLHKHNGLFVKGRYLSDRGGTVVNEILKSIGTAVISGGTIALSGYLNQQNGSKTVANILYAGAGATAVYSVGKGIYNATAVGYYEKNKKF